MTNNQTKTLSTAVLFPLMEEYLLVLIGALADATRPSDYDGMDKEKFDLPEQVWTEIEGMSYTNRLVALQTASAWLAWSREEYEVRKKDEE